jgi:hypothetical protein
MMPEGIPISETVQRKEKHMQGDIIVNGKKMTMTEFVELFFETEDKVKERDLQIKKLQKELDELETELRVKEELFKIKSGLKSEELPESITINGYKCKIIQTEQGLYISRDEIYKIIENEKDELIEKLHITIDVLTDKLTKLREVKGL